MKTELSPLTNLFMITFKQQLTVTEELVNMMAQKLGYTPFIYVREEE